MMLKRAALLRSKAHIMFASGMHENGRATLRMAMEIVRSVRTCNDSIPKHRRLASLGWKGPVW